jgi:hypothetical protein
LRIRGDLRLDMSKILSIVPAQQRAATTQTPRRWARGASRSGSVSVITTHALFALKVQRKVSNRVAGLAAGGASLDREKSRQFVPYSDAARWPTVGAERLLKIPTARGPSGISQRRSSNANSLGS